MTDQPGLNVNPYVLCFLRARGLPLSTLTRDEGNIKRVPHRYSPGGLPWTIAFTEWNREQWCEFARQKFVRVLLDIPDDVELTSERYVEAAEMRAKPLPTFFGAEPRPRCSLILMGVRDVDESYTQWLEKQTYPRDTDG